MNVSAYEKLIEEDNIPRNQLLVFRAIHKAKAVNHNFVIDFEHASSSSRPTNKSLYVEMVEVLGLCGRRNPRCSGHQMQELLSWEKCIAAIFTLLPDPDGGSPYMRPLDEDQKNLLRVHVDFFQWINMDKNVYDDEVVLSRKCYLLCKRLAHGARGFASEAVANVVQLNEYFREDF